MFVHGFIKSLVILAIAFIEIDAQLMCWSCTSDLDVRCHDYFNTTKFDRFYQQNYQGGNYQGRNYQGGNYQGGNYQGGNYQGGNYNPNNPQQNYPNRGGYNNQGYNQGLQNNPYQSRPTVPYIKPCSFSSYGDKKSVCMKKVQTSNDGRTLTIRDCVTIPMSQSVGTCPKESNSYINVDFCEYCDKDGCNSGNGVQINTALGILGLVILVCLRS